MVRQNGKAQPDIAEAGNDDLKTRHMQGPPSKFTCPDCGGALWELENGKVLRYRCHVGHGYTAETLMAAQTDRLEDALWTALRALEETAGMRRRMATRARRSGWAMMADQYNEQADFAESRAGFIRAVLVEDKPRKINAASAGKLERQAIVTVDDTVDDTVDADLSKATRRSGPAKPPPASAGNHGPGARTGKPNRSPQTHARSTRKSHNKQRS